MVLNYKVMVELNRHGKIIWLW